MGIEALNSHRDKLTQPEILRYVSIYYAEVRRLLPELPPDVKIFFSDEVINPETGVGGLAYDHDTITIGFDTSFPDKEAQFTELRGITFHEAFHLAHGYHSQLPPLSALDVAVYEGAAGVFQRDSAGITTIARYGDEAEMMKWLEEVSKLDSDFDWYTWKVYDEGSGQDAILYRLGAFIVDRALDHSGLDVQEFRYKKPFEILELSQLTI